MNDTTTTTTKTTDHDDHDDHPLAVEMCCDDDDHPAWERYAWADWAEGNEDISAWVGRQIATHGTCTVGGGAAPQFTVRRASA